ncbi:MAG: TonB-dependent receptor [Acidobacteriota bacterium]
MRLKSAGALFFLLVMCTAPAWAQRTTGALFGTVTDSSGAVLPGVTVTLTGAAVQGTPTTVTSETGVYRFPALPPGTYTLTFELSGFTTLKRDAIPVSVGGTVQINVQLSVSTIAETITVTGEAPVVNAASAQVTTTFNREWVEIAPQRRFTFFDLINQAAGVSPSISTSSRSVAFGSNTTDNSYQLDGTDFTAPLTGAAWPWPNTDAIEEVEVLGLGASAEYGNVQGAVFNVVTRQGSNQLRFDGNIYLQHQNLTGRNTTQAQDSGLPYNRDEFVDTTWQVGGPAIRDKFWYFGSFQYQKDSESQPGTDPKFPAESSAKRVFAKLNYQFSTDHKIQFAYHDDYYRIPGRATAVTAPSTISVENGHNPSPNVTWTSVLSNKTFFEARYSGFYGVDHGDPLEEGEPRVKPRYHDLDTGQITGGIYSWYDGNSWKSALSAKVSHFADDFMGGSHDVKLGVQYDNGGSDYILGPNDYIYTYGGVPAYGYTQLPWHQGGQKQSIGVYVDDTWRVGERVTITAGVRYDYSKASIRDYPLLDKNGNETGQRSRKIDKVFDWSVFSPRFGVIFKLDADGNTLLKGHVGRYYRGIVTGEFDNTTPSVSPRFLFSGTYDRSGNPIGLELVSDNTNLAVDPDFANPYTDQFILGFERQLVRDFGIQLNYIHKRGEDYGGWRDIVGRYAPTTYIDNQGTDATGRSVQVFRLLSDPDERIFQLTTLDGLYSRYNGFSIQGVKRLSNRWMMNASLTLSKSTGRIGSSLTSPTGSQTGTAGTFGQNPNDLVNTDGRLIADRPVIGKVQFMYELPWEINLGVNYTHQTGRLWSRQVRVGGLGFPSRPTINMEANTGDRRVPNWDIFDVRVEKAFPLGNGGISRLTVFADVLNLTNSDANESIGSRLGTSSSFGLPTRFIHPRRMMVGGRIKF